LSKLRVARRLKLMALAYIVAGFICILIAGVAPIGFEEKLTICMVGVVVLVLAPFAYTLGLEKRLEFWEEKTHHTRTSASNRSR
jgi:hypothetical protein